ncbi:MAG TPA: hypothetical protein VM509_14905, partial [Planctomycetota bacterium]|nr:hypothetical protein [Planctomycetota bacterium]
RAGTLGRSSQERTEVLFEGEFALLQRPLCAMFLPDLPRIARSADQMRALISLCRAALIARRDGAEAARAFLDEQRDPFDAQPLRSRLEGDGVLVLWSIGLDGQDDPLKPATTDEDRAIRDDIRILVRPR